MAAGGHTGVCGGDTGVCVCAGAAEAGLLCRSSGGLGVWAGVGCGLEECGSLACKGKKSLMSFFSANPPKTKQNKQKIPSKKHLLRPALPDLPHFISAALFPAWKCTDTDAPALVSGLTSGR